jgi:hypothetical protein
MSGTYIMGNSRNRRSFDALKIFVAPGGGIKDPDATINPAIFITPQDGIFEVSNLLSIQTILEVTPIQHLCNA